MPRSIHRCFQWFVARKDINSLMTISLFMVTLVPIWFMFVYYHSVIIESRALNNDPMFRMVAQAEAFIYDLRESVSREKLLKDYQWANDFEKLVRSDCHIVSDSLKHLHYIGYIMAGYNVFLMHILLHDIVPISVLASIPIVISLISSDINPSNIIILGLLEFSQVLSTIMIIIIFFVYHERRAISEPKLLKDHKQ